METQKTIEQLRTDLAEAISRHDLQGISRITANIKQRHSVISDKRQKEPLPTKAEWDIDTPEQGKEQQ